MNYQNQKNKKSFIFPLLFSLFIIQLPLVGNNHAQATDDEPVVCTEVTDITDTTKPTNEENCNKITKSIMEDCLDLKSLIEIEENANDELKDDYEKLTKTLNCLNSVENQGIYSEEKKENLINSLNLLKDKLKKCGVEIKKTRDCCKKPVQCLTGRTDLTSTEASFLMALLSGTASGVITAFTNDSNNSEIKAICNGLAAAAAGAGITELSFGATCVYKAEIICREACNITELSNIDLTQFFPDINRLQRNLKHQCDRSATRGAGMIAESAALGTAAGLVAHHCEKIIGGEGGGDSEDNTPKGILERNIAFCAKEENANREFCRVCNPESTTTSEEDQETYNTQVLMRYPSCRQLPIEGTVAETGLFSGGGGRSQRRTPNQGLRNPSQQQGPDLFSGYGRNANSNLGQTSQISGTGGGGGSSIGSGGTTSGNSDSSSGTETENQASNQTSDVGFSGAGGGGGSSGSYYSRGRSKSRWNLRDFLPGRKKDPKKKSSKISKSSRKKLLNVHSKQNNIFVIHSKIIHKFCSNKTLNQCQSSRSK